MYNSLQNHATSGSMNFFPLVLSLGSRTAPRKRMVSRCPIKPWDFRVISHGNILNVYIYYIYYIIYNIGKHEPEDIAWNFFELVMGLYTTCALWLIGHVLEYFWVQT